MQGQKMFETLGKAWKNVQNIMQDLGKCLKKYPRFGNILEIIYAPWQNIRNNIHALEKCLKQYPRLKIVFNL